MQFVLVGLECKLIERKEYKESSTAVDNLIGTDCHGYVEVLLSHSMIVCQNIEKIDFFELKINAFPTTTTGDRTMITMLVVKIIER